MIVLLLSRPNWRIIMTKFTKTFIFNSYLLTIFFLSFCYIFFWAHIFKATLWYESCVCTDVNKGLELESREWHMLLFYRGKTSRFYGKTHYDTFLSPSKFSTYFINAFDYAAKPLVSAIKYINLIKIWFRLLNIQERTKPINYYYSYTRLTGLF